MKLQFVKVNIYMDGMGKVKAKYRKREVEQMGWLKKNVLDLTDKQRAREGYTESINQHIKLINQGSGP